MEELSRPGYLHVVLNHFPVVGMAFGLLAFGVALILRQRAARVVALVLIAAAGLSAWPTYATGERAYRSVRALSDDAGSDALDDHMERAESWIGVFYATAALALAGAFLPGRWPRLRAGLEALALTGSAVSLAASVSIAQARGAVRHPEFRRPPATTERRRGLVGAALTLTVAVGLLGGCAAPDPGAGFAGVPQAVAERTTGRPRPRVPWNRSDADDARSAAEVARLLGRTLTADAAARVALLNNRGLQASFEEVGVAQADYVQAGLLSNPEFSTSLRFPNRPPSALDEEFALAANVLDLFLLPSRRRVAARELEQARLRAAAEALGLIAETKTAVYSLQARQQLLGVLRLIATTNETAADFARRLHDAGNITDLELSTQEVAAAQARVETLQVQAQARSDHERLNRLMGLAGADAERWRVADRLPPLPAREPAARELESFALERRVDLLSARAGVDAVGEALAWRTRTRYLPASINLGVDTERASDRQRVTGPTLDLALPIFDQGQGKIARLQAQYRQTRRRLEAAEINARSEVREARALLLANRELARRYRQELLPRQRAVVEETQLQVNAMTRGSFDLLTARERQLNTERAAVDAQRDYWVTRAELERALAGGTGGGSSLGPAAESMTQPAGTARSASSRPAASQGSGDAAGGRQ